jgi:hypothetical protein
MLLKLKNAWKSWTIWLNGIGLMLVAYLPDMASTFPQLQPYMGENAYSRVMFALTVANIMLRFKTSRPLQER